jgi:hypothetical protein
VKTTKGKEVKKKLNKTYNSTFDRFVILEGNLKIEHNAGDEIAMLAILMHLTQIDI